MASLMLGVSHSWETLGFEETGNHLHLDCVLPDNTDIWPHNSGRDKLEDSGDVFILFVRAPAEVVRC